jgi:hypothetical protein
MLAAQVGAFSLDNSESPEFTGKVVAALARNPKLMERTGQGLVAGAVAAELGVTRQATAASRSRWPLGPLW